MAIVVRHLESDFSADVCDVSAEVALDERLLLALKGPVQATLALLDPAWR
ncbi:MAG: hypothetical protein ACKOOF_13115 [Planctomycetaceae bacterium]